MDKTGDTDSVGSISWEDFFGSSTDLVPSLLSMYDSLLADRLTDSKLPTSVSQSQQDSRTNSINSNSSNEGIGLLKEGWGSELKLTGKGPLLLTTSSSTMNGGGTAATQLCGKRYEFDPHAPVPVTNSVRRGMELNICSSSASCTPNSNIADNLNNTKPLLTRAHWTTTNQTKYHVNYNSLVSKNDMSMKESQKRPVSSTSSSSSCSSSSSSFGGNIIMAPVASPEDLEESPTIPDADVSDTEDTNNSANNNYPTNNNSMDRCLSNSSNKECGDTATNGNGRRISLPIQTRETFKFCDPNLSYMDRVVLEIVETERVYVNDLREIISGYFHHWISNPDNLLPLEEVTELFSNIEEIHKFNSEFLTRLEDCGLNSVEVARCFVTKNEGFSIYSEYCTNYPRTMSILSEMMRQEQSAKAFRERQASLGHSLPLGSYLLKPVQRILKYHLLLQNIVKHYENGMEGHETIVEALSAMTNIAHHINDMKRKHEHAVRVQEIQSLLYGWQGKDLTTYGELCAEGTFRAYGAKALRHVFLFDKMVLITKKKEDGILCYKSHIMCSNLMLIESVPGEPLSFHVIPFDNPRLQCTLQARNLEQKRAWSLQLKRVILENYHAVIPSHAKQLVLDVLGQNREESGNVEKGATKRQHSAPEYLERRKQDRRKSESSLKARLKKARKSDIMMSPKEAFGRRSRKNSNDSSRERSESREREISIDRKMSSASCPPSTSPEKKLVKKLSGWRRKSEPGIYEGRNGKSGRKSSGVFMSPTSTHGTSNLTIDSNSSIGEEEEGITEFMEEESIMDSSVVPLSSEINELDESLEVEECQPNVEERRESIEEIVGQLIMQNSHFQKILSKQRLIHLRKALIPQQYQRRRQVPEEEEEEDSASDTETEDNQSDKRSPGDGKMNTSSGSNVSQDSSSNGIGSSSDMAEISSENICIEPLNGEISTINKNVQRTVSDPGNKATLTPRRFMNGPFAHYDPLSLLWSSFRRSDNRNKQQKSSSPIKGKTSIRHTHSFSCSRKEGKGDIIEVKDPLPLPHGDSGVFPNSFTSDSSSSSEANIPTLPAVWLKQQDEHLATPNNKSGSLPRSFQVGVGQQHNNNLPSRDVRSTLLQSHHQDDMTNLLRVREGKAGVMDRPVTIASDKPSSSDVNYDEMEHYMNKFHNRNRSPSCSTVEDLGGDLTPMTSMESINNLHPDHKIYRPSKSSIKHMLLSVTHRLSGLKLNMLANGSPKDNHRDNVNFGSFSNVSDNGSTKTTNEESVANGKKTSNGSGLKSLNMLPRNYKKALKQKLRNIVREDRDSDSEICDSVTCSSGSSSCENGNNNLTSKIGARLAQSSEQTDYALSKLLLGSMLVGNSNNDSGNRPHSVLSISSTVTSTSSTDEKTSSGLGESLSGSNSHLAEACQLLDVLETLENGCEVGGNHHMLSGTTQGLYRPHKKGINHKELYLSYIDQELEGGGHSDSETSADSFYERSFEAIESLIESELFPDSAIYSADENASANSSIQGSQYSSSWGLSSSLQDNLNTAASKTHPFPISAQLNSISILAARLSNSRIPSSPVPNDSHGLNRRSRLIRSQAILEKLKHLEECSQQFKRNELPSPSFEGIKSIQERRRELELWKQGRISRGEDEYETSSQHSTSTINTVIEISPSKSTSFPSSRRGSDSDSSGGNSPQTERAVSRNSMYRNSSSSSGNLVGDPMPKGWVKLVVGKLQGVQLEDNSDSTSTSTNE